MQLKFTGTGNRTIQRADLGVDENSDDVLVWDESNNHICEVDEADWEAIRNKGHGREFEVVEDTEEGSSPVASDSSSDQPDDPQAASGDDEDDE